MGRKRKRKQPKKNKVKVTKPGFGTRTLSAIRKEATPNLRLSRLKMSRREFLVRSGIGAVALEATALGARRIAKKRIPYWVGAKHRYALTTQFGRHGKAEDALAFGKELVRARKEGKPYHVFFEENLSSKLSELNLYVQNRNRSLHLLSLKLKKMRTEGKTEIQIIQILRPQYRLHDEFHLELNIQLATNNVKVLPIEFHDRKGAKRKQQEKRNSQILRDRYKK